MSSYDENLKDNPFLQEILTNHFDIIEKASHDNWIICIPRIGTFSIPIKERDIFEHVLIPTDIINNFKSLNKTDLILDNNKITYTIDKNSSTDLIKIRILFTEIFYLKHFKYKVFCIENALKQNQIYDNFKIIINLSDCINILYKEGLGDEILNKINQLCTEFLLNHENLFTYTLQALKDIAIDLYAECLKEALKITHVDTKLIEKNNINVSIDTYMQNCLKNQIFDAICTCISHTDANLNKKIRNLQNLQLKHFKCIKSEFNIISSAKFELNKLNKFTTTLGKINCLKNTFKIVSNEKLTSEALLEIFIFIIIKLNINNWHANLIYLKDFAFSSSEDENGENGFLITTLEAAIEFIKTNSLFEEFDTNTSQNKLFNYIKLGNLKQIEAILKQAERSSKNEPKLCHPLCACINCEQVLKTSNFSIQSKDDKGRTLLHLACIYEHPQLVDYFIHKGCNLDATDYAGACPIHYSASKGHQNALLLLIHAGADINAQDNDGNAAIHLAANNGHENCVKALLYYSEHKNNVLKINAFNAHGDTPLHLASKWGYLNIVSILLQYNAISFKNKNNLTPSMVTNNYFIKKLLQFNNACVSQINVIAVIDDTNCLYKSESNSYGVSPKNLDQFKKTDLLLKSIENNDYPLSCFYLGIFYPTALEEPLKMCHPLCSCEKCEESDFFTESAPLKPKDCLNVNICNIDGFTSLHVASKFGRTEILRLLLDIGADINLKTYKCHYSALHLACLNQRIQVVKELLQCGGCNVDAIDFKGNTALHYACAKNCVRLVEVLLAQGADVGVKNNNQKTVLEEAYDNMSLNIIKLIKDKSAFQSHKNEQILI